MVCQRAPTVLYFRDMEHRTEQSSQTPGSEPRIPRHLSFEGSAQPLALHYKPEFMAKGGEHLVYDISKQGNDNEYRDVVVKLNKQSVLDTLALANDLGFDPNSDDPKFVGELKKTLEYKRKMQAALRECFGSEHVAPQKYFLQTVPLPHGIVKELGKLNVFYARELPEEDVVESKAILAVQPYIKELRELHFTAAVGVVEWRKDFETLIKDSDFVDDYAMVTDDLMSADLVSKHPPEADIFLKVVNNRYLSELLSKAKTDHGLRDALRHFIEGAVDFAEKTGEIIDYGKDNVIFFTKPDGDWTYMIIDGLYGLQEDILDTGKDALHILQHGVNARRLNKYQINAMFQAINFTRSTNGMGALIGAKKFYTLSPSTEGRVSKLLGAFYPALKKAA